MASPDESLRAKLHRAIDRACDGRTPDEREALVEAALVSVQVSRDSRDDGASNPLSSWEQAFRAASEAVARMRDEESEIDRDAVAQAWSAARGELHGKKAAKLADRSAKDPTLGEIRRIASVFAEHAAADEEVTVDAIPVYAKLEPESPSITTASSRRWIPIAIALSVAAVLAFFLTR